MPRRPEPSAGPATRPATGAAAGLTVETVTTAAQLDRLREGWERVHAADSHAHPFNSWVWVRAWVATGVRGWRVLCVRSADGEPAAFMLLHGAPPRWPTRTPRTLWLGAGLFADYNGPVCDPTMEGPAMAALGEAVDALPWRELQAREVRDPRVDAWVQRLAAGAARIETLPPTPCAAVELPDAWERYLARLGRRSRERLRRVIRRAKGTGDVRWSSQGYRPTDTAALVQLWARRWNLADKTYIQWMKSVIESCLAAGAAEIGALSVDRRVAAAIAVLHDPVRQSAAYLISGFDPGAARLSPGSVLLGTAIERAIGAGYRWFDFLRGDEAYKQALGGAVAWSRNYRLWRPRN